MIKKLQARNGFSLIELMVTVAVLVLLVVGISTSMGAASRVYNNSTFESESATLAGIIDTSLEDILRYSEIDIDEGKEGRADALTHADFSITNEYYLASKVKLIVDENGYLAFNEERSSHYLVTPGAYHNMKITDFQILYDAQYGVFDISYTIVSTVDPEKSRSESFSVRSANASTAYLLAASDEEIVKYYTVFLHYIDSEENIYFYKPLGSYPSGTWIRSESIQYVLDDIARDCGITSTANGKWYREVGGSPFGQEQLFDNLHLYARFAPDEITVTFDSQGGTQCEQQTCVYGSAYGNLPTPSRTGYTFLGWYTAASGGTQVTSTTKVTASGNQTLYAHWQANTYSVVFNGNGALSGSMASQHFTYDEAQNLKPSAFSWTATVSFDVNNDTVKSNVSTPRDQPIERTFLGWSTSHNARVPQYKDRQSVKNLAESGPVTLYAVWKADDPDYITLPVLSFETSGCNAATYACVGWYTDKECTKLAGQPGTKYIPTKDIKLYAKWGDSSAYSTVTCYYYLDNEQVDKKEFPVEKDKSFTLPEYDGAAYCYVYQWFSDSALSKSVDTTIPTVTGNITRYAELKRNTVTYHNDESNPTIESFTDNYKLRAAPQSSYVFDGWYDVLGNKVGNADDSFPYDRNVRNVDLYAHWLKYTTQFVVKESDAHISGTVKFTGKVPTADVPTATRSGYRFKGWYDSSGTKVIFPYTATTGDVTLHAEWDKAYTVKFDLNGISGAISPLTTETAPAVSLPLPSRTGYSFAGWYTDRTDDTTGVGGSGDSYTPSGDITLYAHWNANSYTVQFHDNGSTGGSMNDQKFIYDQEQRLTANGFTKTGYTFDGWATSATGNVVYTNGQSVKNLITTKDGVFNLYAHWTPNTNTAYTVKHYKQQLDGSYASTPDDTDNLTGTTDTSVTPAVKSYTGFTAPAKKTVTIAGNGNTVVVYQYTRNSYALTWNVNGGKIAESHTPSGSVKFGAELIPPTVTKTGYTFAGWNPAPPKTMPASASIYTAQWTANKYTVAFNGNGGSGSMSNISNCEYGKSYTLTANTFTRAGYTFAGWATSATGSVAYADKASVSNLSTANGVTITLYAKWTPISYTLTLAANGGTCSQSSISYNIESTSALPAPTRTGYTFNGWKVTTAAGSWSAGASANAGTSLTGKYGSATLTAQWTANKYTVAFNGNGNTGGSTVSMTKEYGQTYALTANGFSRTGYTFAGWATSATGSVAYADKASVSNLSTANGVTITLYAKWTPISYTLTLAANGGTCSQSSISYNIESTSALPAPTRTGYTFNGWKVTTAAGSWSAGASANAGTSLTGKYGSATLTAQWAANKYTIAFNANGGSGSMPSMTNCEYDKLYKLTANAFTKTGYTFVGWGFSSTDDMFYSDQAFVSQLSAKDGYTVTLYAKWTPNTNTHYSVKHMLENLNGGYDLKETENKTGTTDTKTSAAAKSYTGFTPQTVTQKNISGNGSTEVEVRYTRNSYTLAWNADGGSLSGSYTSGIVKHGANIAAPANPTKTGFTFAGWDKAVPSTMPTNDLTVTAKWSENSYTISFNANGGSVSPASKTLKYTESYTLPTPTRTGYTFTGWSDGTRTYAKGDSVSKLKADNGATVKLMAQWDAITYDIIDLTTNTVVGSYKYKEAQQIVNLTQPSRDGYKFTSWSASGYTISGNTLTIPANTYGDVTVTSGWEIDTYELYLDITNGSITVNGTKYTSSTTLYFQPNTKITFSFSFSESYNKTAGCSVSVSYDYKRYSTSSVSVKTASAESDLNEIDHGKCSDEFYFNMPFSEVTIVAYSDSESGFCVSEGALIALADGTQIPVEQLTGKEKLLVWNLETGCYDKANIVFVDSDERAEYEIIHLFFSDGSDVEVISEHGFFDVGLGKYVYLDAENAAANIGHRYVRQGNLCANDWETVILTDVKIEHRVTKAYSPVTAGHLCYYVNGILSMPGGIDGLFNIFDVNVETMRYDLIAKANDLAAFGTYSYDDFAALIPEEMFEAFNGRYLKVAMAKGLITWDDIAYLAERYTPLAMDK